MTRLLAAHIISEVGRIFPILDNRPLSPDLHLSFLTVNYQGQGRRRLLTGIMSVQKGKAFPCSPIPTILSEYFPSLQMVFSPCTVMDAAHTSKVTRKKHAHFIIQLTSPTVDVTEVQVTKVNAKFYGPVLPSWVVQQERKNFVASGYTIVCQKICTSSDHTHSIAYIDYFAALSPLYRVVLHWHSKWTFCYLRH